MRRVDIHRRDSSAARFVAAVCALTAGLVGLIAPMPAAVAAPQCNPAPQPQRSIDSVPPERRWFSPERVWPVSRGDGVLVAVLDSGVDAGHPQLEGAVHEGFDFVTNTPGGDGDCDGHGTSVASLIAARPADGIGFVGLAPAAEILPLRVTERGGDPDDPDTSSLDPDRFAAAVRYAADAGADVINASLSFARNHSAIEEAVRYAQRRGAIVVAAAGNHHEPGAAGRDAPRYPAAYDGVIGVGAITGDGTRWAGSYVGPHVDLVAPGDAVVAATPGAGHAHRTGTSFATPLVSAAAALVIAQDPSADSDEVVRVLLATADPPAGGPGYGHGVVNPYRALTERITDSDPVAATPVPDPTVDPAALARAARWRQTGQRAVIVAVIVLVLALAAAAAVTTRRRARRAAVLADRTVGSDDGAVRSAVALGPPTAASSVDAEREFFSVPTPSGARPTATRR